jgi:transcription elongation factor Elf1
MGQGVRRLAKGERKFTHENKLFRCQVCGDVLSTSLVYGFAVCSKCGSDKIAPVQSEITGFCVWEATV